MGTVGKVSGRKWKIQQTKRTSISNSKSSIIKKSYEERMKARELKRKFQVQFMFFFLKKKEERI